jgi:hypothetical protein
MCWYLGRVMNVFALDTPYQLVYTYARQYLDLVILTMEASDW